MLQLMLKLLKSITYRLHKIYIYLFIYIYVCTLRNYAIIDEWRQKEEIYSLVLEEPCSKTRRRTLNTLFMSSCALYGPCQSGQEGKNIKLAA